MKVVRFRELDRCDWDRLALQSPEAWLTHRSAWIEIEERFFVSANLSFALEENSQLVGIQPLFINERAGMAFGERLLHSGIHRHTGLALDLDVGAGVAKAARQAAMQEILAIGDLYDVDRIQLNYHNLAPANRHSGREAVPFWVSEFGFQLGIAFGPSGMLPCPGSSTLNADQLVDLAPTVDELFARLDNSCRTAVRKAEKSNLQFEISSDASYLEAYMDIARASATRTGEALPPLEYYRDIFRSFAGDGGVHLAFVRHDANPIAGLILLADKKAVSFLAGVSLPDAMNLRPNNFLHWNAIRWAKHSGFEVYRFGPWFPEVPRDWPISKVSLFKTKFGSRSLPIVQGSLFRRPELYTPSHPNPLNEVGRFPLRPTVSGQAGASFIAQHLQMFGFERASSMQDGEPLVLLRPGHADVSLAEDALRRGGCVIAVLPSVQFGNAFGVETEVKTTASPQVFHAAFAGSKPWSRLRTLHSYMHFRPKGNVTTIVASQRQEVIWLQRQAGTGGSIIFIGTDLASDLVRYRQGDPAAASNRPTNAMWGIAGERPNYLFEHQLSGENLDERPADWWCETLADAVHRLCGLARSPMLPNGAAGAIVVTGDDDQAALHCYAQQAEALGSLPVTYFLHPLTKHDSDTLNQLKEGRRLELGLHPDALDQPDKYSELFAAQVGWFRQLTGHDPRTVRNHGFLNDGYWGHASAWIAHGTAGSSNLPGLDGRIINGSLLPARLVLNSELTDHWSVLTAIGDGVVFVQGVDSVQSAKCITGLAKRIKDSGVPGVIVVNLHPENIEKTRSMHEAVLDVVRDGFVPLTMSECFEWFERRQQPEVQRQKRPLFQWRRRH
ncbi:lipid II:glycine glycyltransferase FemX [Bradyrhizobium acaciae]|uniref:lipid II:glycine glycyltransferase FemX n=1 Tax=Bradyrhizobium acaciae TaxID=2683706 RepID=UPI001E4EB3F0|nr:GNAT family N-acetyltransferase [Bradyrhizobium acaciae]MCC8980659.1 GNAT family N-acetyltransferase [Bradyrhizobium acaciae]